VWPGVGYDLKFPAADRLDFIVMEIAVNFKGLASNSDAKNNSITLSVTSWEVRG